MLVQLAKDGLAGAQLGWPTLTAGISYLPERIVSGLGVLSSNVADLACAGLTSNAAAYSYKGVGVLSVAAIAGACYTSLTAGSLHEETQLQDCLAQTA